MLLSSPARGGVGKKLGKFWENALARKAFTGLGMALVDILSKAF
jgi:hypothetical protein